MRIAVVGAGGVGGYFGGKLAAAGEDVTFIARGATLDALRTRGLRVDSIDGDFVVDRVNATDDPRSAGPVDAILVATKAWQVPEATRAILPMIGPGTVIVPLENGMEAPRQIAEIAGREHAAGGLCAIVAFIVAPGHIRHAASEPIIMFGELDNAPSARLEALRAAFTHAGVNAEIPRDIHHSMWSKFLFIAPFSAVGATARVPVGAWRSIPETRSIIVAALKEIAALARAHGVDLGEEAVARTMERIDGLAADATSSLQRDVMQGKPSELDAQLGAALRMAKSAGVSAPVCELLHGCLLPQERIARGDDAPVPGAARPRSQC